MIIGWFPTLEKLIRETAESYLKTSNYLWNADTFVWNEQTIHQSITQYNPQIAAIMNRISHSFGKYSEKEVLEGLIPHYEQLSIDSSVMEPASKEGKVITHPADLGWSDLGNWASLHDKLRKDEANNGTVGNVKLYECTD